jgi:hypothetical protein
MSSIPAPTAASSSSLVLPASTRPSPKTIAPPPTTRPCVLSHRVGTWPPGRPPRAAGSARSGGGARTRCGGGGRRPARSAGPGRAPQGAGHLGRHLRLKAPPEPGVAPVEVAIGGARRGLAPSLRRIAARFAGPPGDGRTRLDAVNDHSGANDRCRRSAAGPSWRNGQPPRLSRRRTCSRPSSPSSTPASPSATCRASWRSVSVETCRASAPLGRCRVPPSAGCRPVVQRRGGPTGSDLRGGGNWVSPVGSAVVRSRILRLARCRRRTSPRDYAQKMTRADSRPVDGHLPVPDGRCVGPRPHPARRLVRLARETRRRARLRDGVGLVPAGRPNHREVNTPGTTFPPKSDRTGPTLVRCPLVRLRPPQGGQPPTRDSPRTENRDGSTHTGMTAAPCPFP